MASLNSVASLAASLIAFKTCRNRAPEKTLQSSKSSLMSPNTEPSITEPSRGAAQRQGLAVSPHLPTSALGGGNPECTAVKNLVKS